VLAADWIVFNSRYNRESFFQGVEALLQSYPDYQDLFEEDEVRSRTSILPPAVDFSSLIPASERSGASSEISPRILWTHRWEYDKNPGDFFRSLEVLAERRRDFTVVIAGEATDVVPTEFTEGKKRLGSRIVHWGYAESREAYARLLGSCDILPVTSRQEFFGMSVAEAMYSGCVPLLPDRLAYPELVSLL
jgi:glycosyltransferase involved in cell wall biosynthesis